MAAAQDRASAFFDELASSCDPLRSVFGTIGETVSVIDREFVIRFVNRTLTDRTPESVVGTSILDLTPPESRDRLRDQLERVFTTGATEPIGSWYPGPREGEMSWFEGAMAPIDFEGEIVAASITVMDRTAEARARGHLASERVVLERALDVIDAIVVALDCEGRISLLNRAGAELLEVDKTEALGELWFDRFVPEGDRERTRTAFESIITGGLASAEIHENAVITSGGEERLVLWHNAVFTDEDGAVTGTLSYGQDVTDARATEDALEDRQRTLDGVLRAAPIGVGVVRKRVLLEVSDSMLELTGYSRDELTGQSARMLYPSQEDFEAVGRDKYAQIAERGAGTVETRFVRKDGEIIDILLSSAPIDPDMAEGRIAFTALEITQLKRVERELQQEVAFTAQLIDGMSDTLFALEAETGTPIRWNRVFEEISGYSGDEISRMKAPDEFYLEEDLRRLGAAAQQLGELGTTTAEAELLTKEGDLIPFEYQASALYNPDGEVYGLLAIGRDITERQRAKQDLLERKRQLEDEIEARTWQLAQANDELRSANEAKSEFLAAMSHELRTPLNAIIGFTGIMLDGLAGEITDEQTTQLRMVRQSGTHLLDLVNDILDLSKIEAGRTEVSPSHFVLGDVAEASADLVRLGAEEKELELEVSLADPEVELYTDPRALEQILVNLLGNAVKFTDSGTVRLGASVGDDGFVSFNVIDTGPGIPTEDLKDIFRAFQQVGKPASGDHKGTGLGLAISWRLAALLGGRIDVESVVGRGSRFTLTIPARLPSREIEPEIEREPGVEDS